MASSGSEARPVPPRVGLPTCVEPARWGVWDRPAALLPYSYVAAVTGAGGLPVMLPPPAPPGAGGDAAGPPSLRLAGAVAQALDAVDALVLTGGPDVDPSRYGADRRPRTQAAQPGRDDWESALAIAALARDLPLLAICRGTQVLNVALGGTLHQHVPDVVGHDGHQPGGGALGTTPVRLAPGTPLAALLGEELKVPCYHHQALADLGRGVEAVGWAEDGVVEAAVVGGRSFALAVQWHPEDGDDPRLFQALVAAARGAAATDRPDPPGGADG